MSTADALVVGLGSIGARHVRVLEGLGRHVATVSRRGVGGFTDLATALTETGAGYVVIADETSRHGESLDTLVAADFRGRVLVEKPLFALPSPLPRHRFAGAYVGYNLRFHPVLTRVRALLEDEAPLSAAVFVGQHLSTWRPGRDYKATASARAAAGGGVLRDLSHELDYVLWLFGPWRRVAAIVSKTHTLGIETEDSAVILLECERCPALTIHLDYHHRPAKRCFVINGARHTIDADVVAGRLAIDGVIEEYPADPDETYRRQHEAVATADGRLCRFEEGLAVVALIEAIERAGAARQWVTP